MRTKTCARWALMVLAAFVVTCGAHAQTGPRFEVAAVKPRPEGSRGSMFVFPAGGGRIRMQTASLRDLVGMAYDVLPSQVIGGPKWAGSTLFDINAIADAVPQSVSEYERDTPKRVEALLKERFRVDVHRETRSQPRYVLALARKDGRLGVGMKAASDDKCEEVDYTSAAVPDVSEGLPSWCGSMFGYQGHFRGSKMAVSAFARLLAHILQMPVVDETGLSGAFDMDWNYNPAAQRAFSSPNPAPIEGKTLFDAIEDQLGLRLESRTGPVNVVVIDDALPPDAN